MKKVKIEARGDREIVIDRVFDAPRDLVYDAYTKPALLKQWLGVFDGWSLSTCEMDLRVGGAYRWVWSNPNRPKSMGVSGVFKEIVPHERIVHTERFDEAWYPGEAVNTVTFVEVDGKTTLRIVCLHESTEARDGVMKSGMAEGLEAGYDQLDKLLAR
jgi:uncharacterized protein YndB with AHSA1/START domain